MQRRRSEATEMSSAAAGARKLTARGPFRPTINRTASAMRAVTRWRQNGRLCPRRSRPGRRHRGAARALAAGAVPSCAQPAPRGFPAAVRPPLRHVPLFQGVCTGPRPAAGTLCCSGPRPRRPDWYRYVAVPLSARRLSGRAPAACRGPARFPVTAGLSSSCRRWPLADPPLPPGVPLLGRWSAVGVCRPAPAWRGPSPPDSRRPPPPTPRPSGRAPGVIKGTLIAGTETDPEPETSADAEAPASIHGPARLFATSRPRHDGRRPQRPGPRGSRGGNPMTVMDAALRESLTTLRLSGRWKPFDTRLAGPRRRTWPPRLPRGPLPRRDHPPRDRRIPTAALAASEVRTAGHPGEVRLHGLLKTARHPDPRLWSPALAARRNPTDKTK